MNARNFDIRRTLAAGLAIGTLIVAAPETRAQSVPHLARENGIAYVTGGIGDLGQKRTLQLGQGMGLQAIFARTDGAYVADVDVAIQDRSGKTLMEVNSADPILFADLMPGRYQVVASYGGNSQRQTVEVPAKGRAVAYFTWKTAH